MTKALRKIIPSILTSDFSTFSKLVAKVSPHFETIQIDVMDGKFVQNESFSERTEINDLKIPSELELHLMVADPIAEIMTWSKVKNIKRIIFPIEIGSDPGEVIDSIKKLGCEVGISLNPDTPLSDVEPYLPDIDLVLFMTVCPGRQGAAFVSEVGSKISQFTISNDRPVCSVDGAVSEKTLPMLLSLGAEYFSVGSAIVLQDDIENAKQKLDDIITKYYE